MKILLIADLEGASGVVNNEQQAKPGTPLYQEARNYLISDVGGAVEGALEGGADEVIIFDMHYFGLNLSLEEIHPRAKLVMGKPRKIYPFFSELYQEIKGVMMVGFHAMAQAPGGLLTHSYDHSMKAIYLNGILVGEIGMEAAIAGYYHIPLILVTGDSEGVKEAKSILGEIETVTVKYAINEHSALCLPLAVTRKEIKEKAKKAAKNVNQFAPFIIEPPYAIEVEFFQEEGAQKMEGFSGLQKINEVRVRVEGENLPLLWESFIGFYQQYD